jgi:hypothetical protein
MICKWVAVLLLIHPRVKKKCNRSPLTILVATLVSLRGEMINESSR